MADIRDWDPFTDMVSLREAMNRLMEDSYVGWQPGRGGQRGGNGGGQARRWRLPVDVYTTENEIVVVAPVPGARPEDVEITLEQDTLTIRGRIDQPLGNVSYIAQERATGEFARTLQLNLPVQADKAEAHFENGLLTLTLPKAEELKPRTIKVTAKGAQALTGNGSNGK